MSSFNVLVLPGDHVGPEVMAEAAKVMEAVGKISSTKFNLTNHLAGGCSIDKHGVPVTEAVLKKAIESVHASPIFITVDSLSNRCRMRFYSAASEDLSGNYIHAFCTEYEWHFHIQQGT